MNFHEIYYEYHSTTDYHMSVFLKILHPYQHGNHTEFTVEAILLSHTTGSLNFLPVKIWSFSTALAEYKIFIYMCKWTAANSENKNIATAETVVCEHTWVKWGSSVPWIRGTSVVFSHWPHMACLHKAELVVHVALVINNTGNVRITLRHLHITTVAVEKQ